MPRDNYLMVYIKREICRIFEAFPLFRNGGRAIYSLYFNMFSKCPPLLTVQGQVIPEGSESSFCAAGLRRCRAWNPITGAALPALWHQAPSMQNATAGVYQQLATQFSSCWPVHRWVVWLIRGSKDDHGDTDVWGHNGEGVCNCNQSCGKMEGPGEQRNHRDVVGRFGFRYITNHIIAINSCLHRICPDLKKSCLEICATRWTNFH